MPNDYGVPKKTPQMRAATTGERVLDFVRDAYDTAAKQPLGRVLDAIGMTDFKGSDETFTNPNMEKRAEMPGIPGAKALGLFRRPPFGAKPERLDRIVKAAEQLPNEFNRTQPHVPQSKHAISIDDAVPDFELIDDAAKPAINASGESMASKEAMSRMEGMASRGEKFAVRQGGTTRPLIGPEAVDFTPRRGQEYGIIDANGLFRLLSRGEY